MISRLRPLRFEAVNINGKRALITGAGHGLGKAIAFALARRGAEVIVTDIDRARVSDTVAELTAAKHSALGCLLDVTDEQQIIAVHEQVVRERGPIDVLVNNAGLVFPGAFPTVPFERHRRTIDVNLTGLLAVTHAFLPDLIARPSAALVNIASASAIVPLPAAATYAATKAAVVSFSDSIREELRLLGHRHVHVSAICPSYIATGLFAVANPARLTWLLRADDVAATIVRAIERRRRFVIVPWTAAIFYCLTRGLPRRWYHRICVRLGVTTSAWGQIENGSQPS